MSSETKKTNVYYYQFFLEETGLEDIEKRELFREIDKNIFKEKDSYKRVELSDGTMNLYNYEERHNRYLLGTFVYNQTNNIPPAYNDMDNKPSVLKIGKYEGLGFDSSFIYDRKTRIIGLEYKKPGVSLSSVKDFLEKNFELPRFDLKYVNLPDEYQKFLYSPTCTRLEIDFAIPNNDMGIIKPKEKNSKDVFGLIQRLKSYRSKFIWSSGRMKNNELDIREVKQMVQTLHKIGSEKEEIVERIRATAIDVDTNENKVFDLITRRLKTKLEVAKVRTIGNFQIKHKYDQLEGEYLKYREELEKLQV